MKREYIDWSILRGALIIFVVVVTVSAAIGITGYYFRSAMQQEYSQAQASFNRISSRYLRVDEQEILIQDYYPEFLDLYQQGIIGPERRLDWLESIQQVSDNLEIPGLRYEIESQQESKRDWPFSTGKFRIYSSNMKLNLDMMHELDLLRLVDRLDRVGGGFFSLTDCQISRRSMDMDVSMDSANVNAACNLQWYSLKLSNGEEIRI